MAAQSRASPHRGPASLHPPCQALASPHANSTLTAPPTSKRRPRFLRNDLALYYSFLLEKLYWSFKVQFTRLRFRSPFLTATYYQMLAPPGPRSHTPLPYHAGTRRGLTTYFGYTSLSQGYRRAILLPRSTSRLLKWAVPRITGRFTQAG